MAYQGTISESDRLPLRDSLSDAYVLSLIIAILTAGVSLAGLAEQNSIYPTNALRQAFVANDVINLVVGLPALLGMMWLTRSGRLAGLMCWPGALLYGFYNYIAYVIGRPFDWLTLVFLFIVLLSGYTIFDLLYKMDRKAIKAALTGYIPRKTAGWFLIVFGVLFFFLATSLVASGIGEDAVLSAVDIGVSTADIVLSAFMVGGGILLLRQMPLGYEGSLGLLFGAMLLFVGVIGVVLLQPVVSDASFDVAGLVTLLAMSLVCFIPFVLFWRGVWKGEAGQA